MDPNENMGFRKWKEVAKTSGFRNAMLFIVFICISTLFWFILALNDSAQDSFNVGLHVYNKPDSVTFISDIPERIHVGVRDKGTSLWRAAMRKPVLHINFKDYASDGILRLTPADFQNSLKNLFGPSSQIISVSIDSLRLVYTTNKGKRIPVDINCQVYPASGSIMSKPATSDPSFVYVYGEKNVLDTIHAVKTDFFEIKGISETTVEKINLQKIKNAKIEPDEVSVTVSIEPLVMKEALITVSTINVPEKESLLLFPSKVPVKYYVAMSRLEEDEDQNIELIVDYNDLATTTGGKLNVKVGRFPDRLKNLHLSVDSVEYAIVKH